MGNFSVSNRNQQQKNDNGEQFKKNQGLENIENAVTFDEFKAIVNEKTYQSPIRSLNIDAAMPECGSDVQNMYEKFYGSANLDTIYNTFKYICNKTNSGVFVSLRNGKISKYIPFYETTEHNNWHDQVKLDNTKFSSVMHLLCAQQDMCNEFNGTFYRVKSEEIYESSKNWRSNNNGMMRFDRGTKSTPFTAKRRVNTDMILNLLQTVCLDDPTNPIPDVDFFINLHDYPILSRNETEPYYNMFGRNTPLISHNYSKYLPIVSMCGSPLYADLIIPNVDDWVYAQQRHGVLLPWRTCCKFVNESLSSTTIANWNSKQNVAIFRGTDTGSGYDMITNQRIKLLNYVRQSEMRGKLFNVGFTRLKGRIRKHENSQFLQTVKLPNGTRIANYIPIMEQGKLFKYIINVDGHTASFQLALQMASGACVLKVQSLENWQLWYTSKLIANKHYLPIDSNLENLETQMLQLVDEVKNGSGETGRNIANCASDFALNHALNKDIMVKYMKNLLYRCHIAQIK